MINNQLIADIKNYVGEHGGSYSGWYAGIATNPKDRLFSDHNVQEEGGAWIFNNAGSEQNARDTEKHLLNIGFDGGDGGGDTPIYVYAYKKTSDTIE